MRAFHNDPKIAAKYRARVAAHAAADEIIKGVYWEKGKGCAVGCTVHASNHAAYESELGIPIALAYLEDAIFEGLPIQLARTWPKRFLAAPSVGADLSLVQWRFFYWLCTQRKFGAFHDPLVTGAVSACAKVMKRLINGEKPIDVRLAAQKAKDAAYAAVYAAANAAVYVYADAEAAANAAVYAADAAVYTADAAVYADVEAAANAAARAAVYAARTTNAAAWVIMSKHLLRLMAQAA